MAEFDRANRELERARCNLCLSSGWMPRALAIVHEDCQLHVLALRDLDSHAPPSSPPPAQGFPLDDGLSEPNSSPQRRASTAYDDMDPDVFLHGPALADDPDNQLYDNWGGELGAQFQDFEPSVPVPPLPVVSASDPETGASAAAQSDSANEESFAYAPTDPVNEKISESQALEPGPSAGVDKDGDWFPWKTRPEALMHLTHSFPRGILSEAELEAIRWLLDLLGVQDIPGQDKSRELRKDITERFGAETQTVDGKCGNVFSYNDIETIIRHEWANPLVRHRIQTYAERSETRREHACQGERWAKEVDASLAGPMARAADRQDYFVGEVALAAVAGIPDNCPVLISRWFTLPADASNQDPRPESRLHASVELLDVTVSPDGARYVRSGRMVVVPLSAFQLSYPRLAESYSELSMPPPDSLCGPNEWRGKAAGARVLSVPISAYCDDTSGNVSKKWNKHNSFLFVLSGLPREDIHLPYNVHFFSTSNLASPLEMMEQLAAAIVSARSTGWWAWDCLYEERVLLVPWAFGLQGDNPMQSELSSHIGLNGKRFCRVCEVRDKDKVSPGMTQEDVRLAEAKRLNDFMTCHAPRTKEKTLAAVQEQLDAVLVHAAPSRLDKLATESGVKDKYFMHFFEKLEVACAEAKKGDSTAVLEVIQACRATLPDDLFNPALSIPELDPARDTPVEILHVVLLGFVKYFWRDAVSRLNTQQKEELKARLASVDISGLQIDRIQANTLVQFAGSLVGRDFRIVLQVAPSVLEGMISSESYQAWLALCDLSALVFRPVIEEINVYIPLLERAIDRFLEKTALWNFQWFNKPKFHIILHLPGHIRRFGPAPLNATETFESFNHVIRLRSIHSNRHAPSTDIAHAFSQLHAVRHLVSGGWIPASDEPGAPLRQAGRRVLSLANDPRFRHFMGMDGLSHSAEPIVTRASEPREWTLTDAGKQGASAPLPGPNVLYRQCSTLKLSNADVVRSGTLVVFGPASNPRIGRTVDLLVDNRSRPERWAVVAPCSLGSMHPSYQMPRIACCSSAPLAIPSTIILGTVSSFHACAGHGCSVSRTRVVSQERFRTATLDTEIVHRSQPDDRILNLAQLRNGSLLDKYRPTRVVDDAAAHRTSIIQRALDVQEMLARIQAEEKRQKEEDKVRREEQKARKAEEKARKAEEKVRKAAEKASRLPQRGRKRQDHLDDDHATGLVDASALQLESGSSKRPRLSGLGSHDQRGNLFEGSSTPASQHMLQGSVDASEGAHGVESRR